MQPAQTPEKPLTVSQIIDLLDAGVDNARIANAVKERGINFAFTEEFLGQLRSKGAKDVLIKALQSASPTPISKDELLRIVQIGGSEKLDSKRIVQIVKNRGIDFLPSDEYLDTLRIAGATDAVLQAVRDAGHVTPTKDSPPSTNIPSLPQLKLPKMQPPNGVMASASNGPGYGGAYSVGGGVSAPKETYSPAPEYSEAARNAKIQGSVVLSLVVDAQGNPKDIQVVRPLGMGLDEKALEKVRTWKFAPGMRNGVAVPVRVLLEVTFRLSTGPLPIDRRPVDAKLPSEVQGRLGFTFAEMDWHDPQKVTWDRFATDVIYWWTRQGGSAKYPSLLEVPAQLATYAIVERSLEYSYSYGAGTAVTTAIHVEVYRMFRGQIEYPPVFISKNTSSVMGAFKDAAKYLTKNATGHEP